MLTVRAFQELHNRCRDRVFSGIMGYVGNVDEAEDITASAFAAAFRKRRSFRGEASFSTWVYRIALNLAHSAKRGKRMVSLDALGEAIASPLIQSDTMDRALDKAACCRRLRLALKRIPANYSRALIDHFVRGWSTKRIARLQHIPVGTVLSRIHTAKRILRKTWEE